MFISLFQISRQVDRGQLNSGDLHTLMSVDGRDQVLAEAGRMVAQPKAAVGGGLDGMGLWMESWTELVEGRTKRTGYLKSLPLIILPAIYYRLHSIF